MTEVTVAMVLMWWISVILVSIGSYLVFVSEDNTPMVIMIGSTMGLLGSILYLIVRQPVWAFARIPDLPNVLLPSSLGLFLIYVVLETLQMWRDRDLDRPDKRVRTLLRDMKDHDPRQRR